MSTTPNKPGPHEPGPHEPGPHKPGLARSLGAFVGEILKAVKTDPAKEQGREPARGEQVVLRRTTTTVDEVVLRKGHDDAGRQIDPGTPD